MPERTRLVTLKDGFVKSKFEETSFRWHPSIRICSTDRQIQKYLKLMQQVEILGADTPIHKNHCGPNWCLKCQCVDFIHKLKEFCKVGVNPQSMSTNIHFILNPTSTHNLAFSFSHSRNAPHPHPYRAKHTLNCLIFMLNLK